MTLATWGAVVEYIGPAAVVLATLSGVALAWRQTHQADRHGVSSHESQARRDTIADRDSLIDDVVADRDQWRARAVAAESTLQEWSSAAMGHAPWDWAAQEIAHECGRDGDLGPPPPLRPPPTPRHREEEE